MVPVVHLRGFTRRTKRNCVGPAIFNPGMVRSNGYTNAKAGLFYQAKHV